MNTELDNLHEKGADGENIEKLNTQTNESPVEEKNSDIVENETTQKVSETTIEEENNSQEGFKEEAITEEDDIESEIPLKNYDELPLAVLIGEAKSLLQNHSVHEIREHFKQIKDVVRSLLEQDEKAQREAFAAQEEDLSNFVYDNPHRREFNAIYNEFRKQLDNYYKEQEEVQKKNLEERLQIIEELKSLYLETNENNSNIFSRFRKLKTRWHNAGVVPKANAGNVFRTYYHHLDNFYEYLNLNKELREMDFAHNLEVRESIIKRAEELVEEENVQKALNELQYLHRLWKEEAVPVAEELREPTWQRFKELTQKIHNRKAELAEIIKKEQEDNLLKKQEILSQIESLTQNTDNRTHGEWQSSIKKINALRESFLAIGRVPKEFNQQTWEKFKTLTKEFNHVKNEFYKNLKSEQQKNLEKKQELLRIAKEHAESTDWNNSVQIIKKIQADWKKIGHVPRKISDKIWIEFKDACNTFFERYKERNNQFNQEFEENYLKKEALLNELKEFTLTGNSQQDLDTINDFNVQWNSIGKVPSAKININNEFNKIVNELIKSLGLSQNEIQDFKMGNLIEQIKTNQDERLLDEEIRKTRKTIDEVEKEINQLETNIGFFGEANQNSPLLKDVYRQIEDKRTKLTELEIRLRKLHQIDFEEETE